MRPVPVLAGLFALALLGCEDDDLVTPVPDATPSPATSSARTGESHRVAEVAVVNGANSATDLSGYAASAAFREFLEGSPGETTATPSGDCVVKTYVRAPRLGRRTAFHSAGDISIAGGTESLLLHPDRKHEYPKAVDDDADLFAPGDTITLRAAGGDVPAFESIRTAPSPIDLRTPENPGGAPLPIDRSQDLVLTWDGGEFGDLFVRVSDDRHEIDCLFPTATGTGTLPAAALAVLSPTSEGSVLMAPASMESVQAGDWTVQVVLFSSFTWNGAIARPQIRAYAPM
ncbi:MAG: hypothetical protein U0414_40425 [Polyangiaceae bacterium]